MALPFRSVGSTPCCGDDVANVTFRFGHGSSIGFILGERSRDAMINRDGTASALLRDGVVDDGSGSGIVIRTLTLADIGEVRRVDLQLFPVRYSDEFYTSLGKNPSMTLVAVDDDNIVAVVSSRVIHSRLSCRNLMGYNHHVGYISTLGVLPPYRRRGIAKLLLERIISVLKRDCQCQSVYLHVKVR